MNRAACIALGAMIAALVLVDCDSKAAPDGRYPDAPAHFKDAQTGQCIEIARVIQGNCALACSTPISVVDDSYCKPKKVER